MPTLTPSVLSRGPGTGQRGSIFIRFGGHQNFRLTHAQEDREAARVKVRMVTEKLKELKLEEAAALVEGGAGETFSYYGFSPTHWRSIRPLPPGGLTVKPEDGRSCREFS